MAGPHYVTKCLLDQFAGDSNLFELQRVTGKIELRALHKAGAEIGIWTDDIETGMMQEMDTDGHRVLRELLKQSGDISLSYKDRNTLNQWLFFYLIRVPANRELCKFLFRTGQITRSQGKFLDENRLDLITKRKFLLEEARERDPKLYEEKVKKWGKEALEKDPARWQEKFFLRQIDSVPEDGVGLFQEMLTSGNFRNYTHVVGKMRWVWLRTNSDFIIGDNPFCRCDSRTGQLNCPLKRDSLEVFFPLSRKLCLWMHRRMRRVIGITIDESQTVEINRRQIQNAVAKVWGPTQEALFDQCGDYFEDANHLTYIPSKTNSLCP